MPDWLLPLLPAFGVVLGALLGAALKALADWQADRRQTSRDELQHQRANERERLERSRESARDALKAFDVLWLPLRDTHPQVNDGFEWNMPRDDYRALERAIALIPHEVTRTTAAGALRSALNYGTAIAYVDASDELPVVMQRGLFKSILSTLTAHARGDEPDPDVVASVRSTTADVDQAYEAWGSEMLAAQERDDAAHEARIRGDLPGDDDRDRTVAE